MTTTMQPNMRIIREQHRVLEDFIKQAKERIHELESQQKRLQLECPHPGVIHEKEREVFFLTCPDCGASVANDSHIFEAYFSTM